MNSRERSFSLLLHQGFDSVQIGQLFYWNSIHIAPIGINKAEILSTNSANERPHEETLNDLIQPSKLAVILQFYSQKNRITRPKFFPQTEQMKGLMEELLKTSFKLFYWNSFWEIYLWLNSVLNCSYLYLGDHTGERIKEMIEPLIESCENEDVKKNPLSKMDGQWPRVKYSEGI